MSDRNSVYSAYGVRYAVGLSSILQIGTERGLIATTVKYFSGGSLELVGFDSTGATITWGSGYLFSPRETLNIDNSGDIFLAATGATVIAMVVRGRSAGIV